MIFEPMEKAPRLHAGLRPGYPMHADRRGHHKDDWASRNVRHLGDLLGSMERRLEAAKSLNRRLYAAPAYDHGSR